MSQEPQQPPEGGEQQPENAAMSSLDQAFLKASKLRMIGEDTHKVAAGMSADDFGHADLAAMVQQVTQQLGDTATGIASRMEQDLHAFACDQQHGDGGSHG